MVHALNLNIALVKLLLKIRLQAINVHDTLAVSEGLELFFEVLV